MCFSDKIEGILRQIYRSLKLAVSLRSSPDRRQVAMQVLELIANLKRGELCVGSYNLFLTILADVGSDHWLWNPAELAVIGAFQWGIPRPDVGDPAPLVRFLAHCFSQQEMGAVVDVPVERAMLALAGAPAEVIGDGIARVDFTSPPFFNGICHALRDGAPYPLRRATVTFLRHLDTQIFDRNKTFSQDQVNGFISGWSSSAQESLEKEHGSYLLQSLTGTLMGLLDSPFWRNHIPQDRWSILTLLRGIPEDQTPPSFYRCAENSAVIPHLKQVNVHPKVLPQWALILWANYHDLSAEVKSQLEIETKEMLDRSSKHVLSAFQETVEEQVQRTQEKINSHTPWSFGADVAKLRGKLESLQQARKVLKDIQKLLR